MSKMNLTDQNAIEGLILLGRSREEAEQEIKQARKRAWDNAEREMWDLHDFIAAHSKRK